MIYNKLVITSDNVLHLPSGVVVSTTDNHELLIAQGCDSVVLTAADMGAIEVYFAKHSGIVPRLGDSLFG